MRDLATGNLQKVLLKYLEEKGEWLFLRRSLRIELFNQFINCLLFNRLSLFAFLHKVLDFPFGWLLM